MPIPRELIPHLAEVLNRPQFTLRAIGPLPRADWLANHRPRIESLGGEWLAWPAPAGGVAIVTDLNLSGLSATRTAGILLESLAESIGPEKLEVSAGWLKMAKRMADLLEGAGES